MNKEKLIEQLKDITDKLQYTNIDLTGAHISFWIRLFDTNLSKTQLKTLSEIFITQPLVIDTYYAKSSTKSTKDKPITIDIVADQKNVCKKVKVMREVEEYVIAEDFRDGD
jgi:hypothetical protein